jgi:hypothetical protein
MSHVSNREADAWRRYRAALDALGPEHELTKVYHRTYRRIVDERRRPAEAIVRPAWAEADTGDGR